MGEIRSQTESRVCPDRKFEKVKDQRTVQPEIHKQYFLSRFKSKRQVNKDSFK